MRAASMKLLAVLIGACALAAPVPGWAKSFHELYPFQGGDDGDGSVDRLLLDAQGNIYGVTPESRTSLGTVFMLSPGGTKTVLHSFVYTLYQSSRPTGGVVMDAAGNLYGEARNGGQVVCVDNDILNPDCGSIYKLAPDGTLTTIHSFEGGEDGGVPQGGLMIDGGGNLYGTTKYGGAYDTCNDGCGTVFKLAPDGTKTVLYSFAGHDDGSRPSSGLVADESGNLYGTAPVGGLGYGQVFRLAPDGTKTTLHAFSGTDGQQPSGTLALDKAGNLYGTAPTGGSGGRGVVFKLAPGGAFSVLHAFADGDGEYPTNGVAMDRKGNLYGATIEGGTGCGGHGCGTVFRIAEDGTYAQLARLKGRVAHNPLGGVSVDRRGRVYGSALGRFNDPAHLGILYKVK